MAELMPQSTLVVIEDCGHLAPLEKPEEVNAAMRAWMLQGIGD